MPDVRHDQMAAHREMSAFRSVLRQCVEVAGPGDDLEVLVSSIRYGIPATPCRKVDQRPQIGRSGELQSLARVSATTIAPGGQDGVGVRGRAVEPQQVAQVGERVARVRELPVEQPGHLQRGRVEQQVLGVGVGVHEAGTGHVRPRRPGC